MTFNLEGTKLQNLLVGRAIYHNSLQLFPITSFPKIDANLKFKLENVFSH